MLAFSRHYGAKRVKPRHKVHPVIDKEGGCGKKKKKRTTNATAKATMATAKIQKECDECNDFQHI